MYVRHIISHHFVQHNHVAAPIVSNLGAILKILCHTVEFHNKCSLSVMFTDSDTWDYYKPYGNCNHGYLVNSLAEDKAWCCTTASTMVTPDSCPHLLSSSSSWGTSSSEGGSMGGVRLR